MRGALYCGGVGGATRAIFGTILCLMAKKGGGRSRQRFCLKICCLYSMFILASCEMEAGSMYTKLGRSPYQAKIAT